TFTVKLHEPGLPLLSVVVHVTVVVPVGKLVPLAGEQVALPLPELSLAVAVKVTLLEHVPGAVLTTMLPGQVTTGFSWSSTFTVKLHEPGLPLLSVVLHVTVVVPFGKLVLSLRDALPISLPQLSLAVAVKVTLLEHVPGA